MTPPMAGTRSGRLLQAARAGDRESLNALVRELSPMLWHIARAQGLDRMSCSDIVQSSWLRLISSWDEIHTPDALVTWLVTVTKREAWRLRRKSGAEHPVDDWDFEDLVDETPTPEQRVVTQSSNNELWGALKKLSARCQQLLRIVAFTHRPDYSAIGAELGIPRGTVGPTRGRCLAKLRVLLSGEGGGDDGRG